MNTNKTKILNVNGEEILAWHVFLLLNMNAAIRYKDFMNRVTNNWKKIFGKNELMDYANKPLGGR